MGGMMMAAAIKGGGGSAGGDVTVALTPANISSGATSGGHVGTMRADPAGGDGTYTYSWVVVTPDPTYALTINAPHARSTDFDFSPAPPAGVTAQAKVRCTATSAGDSASDSGFVTFVNNASPPPTPPPITRGGYGGGSELPQ